MQPALPLIILLAVSTSAEAGGDMGGVLFFGPLIFLLALVLIPIWLIVRWVKSGKNKSHAEYKNRDASRPPLGRLGE